MVQVMIVAVFLSLPLAGRCAEAPEKDKPPYAPPVADEAHGLKGAEREAALHVLRAHYGNLLGAFDGLKLPGVAREDFSKPAACTLAVSIRPGDFRPGSFVDGVPVRRAQPIVFNSFQRQVVEGAVGCWEDVVYTRQAWQAVEDAGLDALVRDSGTTYCRADSDCYGAELTVDPCGARRRVRVFGSNTTDAVFFIALRKFMPPLLHNVEQMVNGSVMQYGERHPDHGIALGTDVCPMKHWEEAPLPAVCVEHSCRAAP